MEQVKKLEQVLAGWYKNAPHLPQNGQKWLTQNAWWIVLIGVILGAIGVVAVVMGTLFAGTLLTAVGGLVGAAVGGFLLVVVLISLVFSVIELVLMALAIAPLKDGKKKGWNYLFVAFIVTAIAVIVDFILHVNGNGFMSLVWNAICLAIGGYFIFEIRSYMLGAKATHAKAAK